MKKNMIFLTLILASGFLFINSAKADTESKKVQTNYQYKLVCGYYNNSDKLTWGAQERIGDFKDENGYESNSERACGATSRTKNYPIGDPNNNNLPKNATIFYDSCNGSTGKQKAKVGTSCTQEGKVKTCSVKWSGYCYKDSQSTKTKKTTTVKKKNTSSPKFYLAKTSITVGNTTKIKNINACASFKIRNNNIVSYDAANNVITGLNYGSTYIECYDENNNYVSRRKITVKPKTNYRYVNQESTLYETATAEEELSSLRKCKKVNYLEEKVNGYCKIMNGKKVGYINCNNLNTEKPTSCY